MSPSAPVPKSCQPRQLNGVIDSSFVGTRRCGTEPDVPIERGWNGIRAVRPGHALRPDRTVARPDMDFAHLADGPGLHPIVAAQQRSDAQLCVLIWVATWPSRAAFVTIRDS